MDAEEIHTIGEVYEKCGLQELLLRKGFGNIMWRNHVGEDPYYHRLDMILKHATQYLGNMLIPVKKEQLDFISTILSGQYEKWTFPVINAPAISCLKVVFFVGEKGDLLKIRMLCSSKCVDFKRFYDEEAYMIKGIKEFYDILS